VRGSVFNNRQLVGVFPIIATIVVPGFPYDWHCEEVVQPIVGAGLSG